MARVKLGGWLGGMRREVDLVVARYIATHRDRAQRGNKSGTVVQGYVPAMGGLWLSGLG